MIRFQQDDNVQNFWNFIIYIYILNKEMIEKDDLKGFAVHPKLDCPHLAEDEVNSLLNFLLEKNTEHFSQFKCATCQDSTENWICLKCHSIQCSRYVKSHMVAHNDKTKHSIALSFSDSSFWCYDCESYIDHPSLIRARKQFSKSKFAAPLEGQQQLNTEKDIIEKMQKMELSEKQNEETIIFTYENLIDGLKSKKYKKVVFLTGAGLSVAAGIPDFRTPGTGLYSQLEKYNLPQPEAIFTLSYFAKDPKPFITLSKQWLQGDFQPTDGHKFIKKIQDQQALLKVMTQNIDDLQIKAGLSEEKLLQAHGHSRTARCIKCREPVPIENWKQAILKDEALVCEKAICEGLIKPDIIFFGEQLPAQFHTAPSVVEQSDLVIIIGTSLKVFPFAFLAQVIPKHTPTVLINNTEALQKKENFLWLDGDIQQNIKKIAKDVGWQL